MVSAHLFSCFWFFLVLMERRTCPGLLRKSSVFIAKCRFSVSLLLLTDLGQEKTLFLLLLLLLFYKFSCRLSCDLFAIMQSWSL